MTRMIILVVFFAIATYFLLLTQMHYTAVQQQQQANAVSSDKRWILLYCRSHDYTIEFVSKRMNELMADVTVQTIDITNYVNNSDWPMVKNQVLQQHFSDQTNNIEFVWLLHGLCYSWCVKIGCEQLTEWVTQNKPNSAVIQNANDVIDWTIKLDGTLQYSQRALIFRRKHIQDHQTPITFNDIGEIFNQAKPKQLANTNNTQFSYRADSKTDITLFRGMEYLDRSSINVYFTQAAHLIADFSDQLPLQQLIVTKQNRNENLWLKLRNQRKTKFCAMIVKAFAYRGYAADVLVRGAFLHYLNRNYKHCHTLGMAMDPLSQEMRENGTLQRCEGGRGWVNTVECFEPYKFTISMDNTRALGYVSEKIMTSLFADSIPIYFGAPDVGRYINTDRIIHCPLTDNQMDQLRLVANKEGFFADKETDEYWLNRTIDLLQVPFSKCLTRVKEVDENDDLWKEKWYAPIYPENKITNTIWDHTTVANSIIQAVQLLTDERSVFL